MKKIKFIIALILFAINTVSVAFAENLPDDINELQKLAEKGDVEALNKLGDMYYDGEGVEQNYAEAVKYYHLAADQGYAAAQYNLGYCYNNGEGVPQNYAEAVKYYRLAADQGYAAAQNNLGVRYYNGEGVPQNYAEAVKYYRLAADQGYAAAQNNLGNCYNNGKGVPQNYAEAVKYYRLAADQGYAAAQNNLGSRYYDGKGVSQDYSEAFKYYLKAAEKGNINAWRNVGRAYYYGLGVNKNESEGLEYLKKWAEKQKPSEDSDAENCYSIYYSNDKYFVYNLDLNKVIIPPIGTPECYKNFPDYYMVWKPEDKPDYKYTYYDLTGKEIVNQQEFILSSIGADDAFYWKIDYKFPAQSRYKIVAQFYDANGTPLKIYGEDLAFDQGELKGTKNSLFFAEEPKGSWDYAFFIKKGVLKRNTKYLMKIHLYDINGKKIPLKNDRALPFTFVNDGNGGSNWILDK